MGSVPLLPYAKSKSAGENIRRIQSSKHNFLKRSPIRACVKRFPFRGHPDPIARISQLAAAWERSQVSFGCAPTRKVLSIRRGQR